MSLYDTNSMGAGWFRAQQQDGAISLAKGGNRFGGMIRDDIASVILKLLTLLQEGGHAAAAPPIP